MMLYQLLLQLTFLELKNQKMHNNLQQNIMKVEIKANILLLIITILAFGVSSSTEENICQSILLSIRKNDQKSLQSYIEDLQGDRNFPCVLELFPRYFWGQNMTHIFVKFQFLNSADTSACERVLSVRKQVEHNQIILGLICLHSNLIIRYRISVTTLMPLNFYYSVWKEADQNTIILECLKSPNPYFWKTLYLPEKAPLRKPKVWWKIVEKYMEDTKKFIYDLQVQEEELDISSYVKKKKKGRKSKESVELEPFSKKYLYCNQNNPFELGSWI